VAVELRMPRLNPGMEKGIVVAWLVQQGDPVSRGQAIVQVESDKAVLDVEAPVDGHLRLVHAPKGRTVPVGALLAEIE